MKVNFYTDKKHLNKEDECLILVSIHFLGKRARLSTRMKVKPGDFDSSKQKLIPEALHSESTNLLLDKIKHELVEIELRARIDQVPLTVEYIKSRVTFIHTPSNDFFDIWDQFIHNGHLTKGWREGTLKRFATTKMHLLEFEKKYRYRIEFDSINDTFLEKFLEYHNDLGFGNVFTEKNVKMLKWFLNWTVKKKLNKNVDFQGFELGLSKPTDEDNIVYLTIDELARVYNLKFEEKKSGLEQARDVFVFACFTGLRYSDLQKLKKTDVSNNALHLTTQKTRKKLDIPLNEYAKAILKRYADYPGDNALPVISNQKYNDHLKTLGQLAKLNDKQTIIGYSGSKRTELTYPKWQLLTTHVARKTFITTAVYFKIPIEVVVKLTGQGLDVVKRYYEIQDKSKERAMKKFSQMRIVS